MSVFWIGGPEGVIVPAHELKATEEDRYFMPGVIHGSEDYIIQAYYWCNAEGPEGDRIGVKYLYAASILDWAKEATGKDGQLGKDIFEELINENAEEFIIENDGSGDFVTLNDIWDQAKTLSYQEVISWAQKQMDKEMPGKTHLVKSNLADIIDDAEKRKNGTGPAGLDAKEESKLLPNHHPSPAR